MNNDDMTKIEAIKVAQRLTIAAREFGVAAHQKFPDSSPERAANHLREEADELIAATDDGCPKYPEREAAGIFLILCHYCHMQGIDLGAEVAREWNRISPLPIEFDPAAGYSRVVTPTE